jgi:RNA polymerase subunit RPABC4/transcription elongation factor Spt4
MKCPKCGSKNIAIQAVTEVKEKRKKGFFYWLLIGWWWELFAWVFSHASQTADRAVQQENETRFKNTVRRRMSELRKALDRPIARKFRTPGSQIGSYHCKRIFMKVCQYCGKVTDDSKKECNACGSTEFSHQCENCGTVFDSAFCPNCGTKAGKKAFVCPDCGTRYFSAACPNCGYSPAGKPRFIATLPRLVCVPGPGKEESLRWNRSVMDLLLADHDGDHHLEIEDGHGLEGRFDASHPCIFCLFLGNERRNTDRRSVFPRANGFPCGNAFECAVGIVIGTETFPALFCCLSPARTISGESYPFWSR